MSRRIDHRSSPERPADDVAAVMLDEEYLRARLVQLGGPGAALLEHQADATGGRYRIRQGVDAALLPAVVSTLVSGNLVIERTESLRRLGGGQWGGDVRVAIPGTPASAAGSLDLRDAGTGSELIISADVRVDVPFFGGRIEGFVAEQVQLLLAAETAFTMRWLAGDRA
jgi:hypothetical protein